MESMLAGRSMMSAGGFARVTVNDSGGLGDTITDSDGTVSVHVRIEALPILDVTHVMVFANCSEVAKVAAEAPYEVVKYEGTLEVPITEDAHITIAAIGRDSMPAGYPELGRPSAPRVMTNPIYIDVDGNGHFDPPGGRACDYDLSPPAP